MNDRQESYINMGFSALAVMNENSSKWSSNTVITDIVGKITDKLNEAGTIAGMQMITGKGATKSQNFLWQTAADLTMHNCFGMKAYYKNTGDSINLAIVDFTISDFIEASKLVAKTRMQTVHDNAASITPASDLIPYGIVGTDIISQQKAIDNFNNSTPIGTMMRADSKSATTQLIPIINALRNYYDILDDLMGTFKLADAAFYNSYKNSRNIINLGKTMTTAEMFLLPGMFDTAFGKKFKVGDWITIRNESEVDVVIFLTDNINVLPTTNGIKLGTKKDLKVLIGQDFGGTFGHWVLVNNPNKLDNAHVVLILSHTKNTTGKTPGTSNLTPLVNPSPE